MKYVLLFLAILVLPLGLRAQGTKDDRPLADRLWYGGNLGLLFGTVTSIQIDPMIGYKVDPKGKYMAGIGASYWHFKDNRFNPAWSFTGYGYRVFNRYRVIEQAFLHAEFLHMNVDGARNELFGPLDQRIWVPHLMVGAGYMQGLGGRSGVFVQILFEVLQDPNSMFFGQGPIFSVGGGIGF
jgi:hypothetical protein